VELRVRPFKVEREAELTVKMAIRALIETIHTRMRAGSEAAIIVTIGAGRQTDRLPLTKIAGYRAPPNLEIHLHLEGQMFRHQNDARVP
jgi:ABC-type hemin transport system ATPase subunit